LLFHVLLLGGVKIVVGYTFFFIFEKEVYAALDAVRKRNY